MSELTLDASVDAMREQATAPGLVLVWSGGAPAMSAIPAGAAPVAIGRGAIGPIASADARISRDHASVSWDEGRWTVRDYNSRNGTYVDLARVGGELRFDRARVIRAGDSLLVPVPDVRPYTRPVETAGGVVRGPILAAAWSQAERAARGQQLISVVGEAGSGRSLLARHLHEQLGGGPFVVARASELSSAAREHKLAAAAGGSLCVDEDTGPLADTRVFMRLERASQRGVSVAVPSLRERITDIPWLIATAVSKPAHVSLVEEALERPWFGSVAELLRELAEAQTRAGDGELRGRHLSEQAGRLAVRAPPAYATLSSLTPRERQVLTSLLEGQAEKEIAGGLELSVHTVHQYVKGLYRKLGVRSRGELLARFLAR